MGAGTPSSAAAEGGVHDRRDLLSGLFEAGGACPWGERDLAEVFRHQMSAPTWVDAEGLEPGEAAKSTALCAAKGLLLRSFDDLFRHPRPPIELLVMTKRFAKAMRCHPDSPLPPPVARVLYYLAVVAARVRCAESITRLKPAALADGVRWALEQAWIDEPTRRLLGEGLALLCPDGKGTS